jgi:FAD/FMN-containing dehydrogenase
MLTELRDGRAGTALFPDDEAWGENPPAYVPPGDPAVVVRPETTQQVAEALRFAAAQGLGVAIRSGGHGGRLFDQDACMVIEMQHFNGVAVDGTTVRVGPAAVWGDVGRELGLRDLGISSGDTKDVGVGGLTLGGGVGWRVREHGLAIDSLISATVVLPSGEFVTASSDEHSDLFWALRGGGGNFGVVTEFAFQAHPIDGAVFGPVNFAPDDVAAVLTGWRDVMREAPEQLNATFLAMPAMGPEMPAATNVHVFWPGRDAAPLEPWLERLREVPGYIDDDVKPMDYVDVLEDAVHFPGPPPTLVSMNGFSDDFSDETIAAVAAAHASLGGVLMVRYVRGAFNRVPADATAWAERGAEAFIMGAAFLPPGAPQADIDEVHRKWDPVLAHTTGTYGNFADRVGDETLSLMYPPATLARLREVKRTYDPGNLLSRNQNIVP